MSSPPLPKHERAAVQQYWYESGFTGIIARASLRTLQFATAIILVGIYGSDLSSTSHFTVISNTNWIFALVVAILSALTCILHCFLTIKRVLWIFWDFVLCVLYAALAGTFGSTYLGNVENGDAEVTKSVKTMRAGVAFALLGMCLWLISWVQGLSWCCTARRVTRKTDVPRDEEESIEIEGLRRSSQSEDGESKRSMNQHQAN